MPGFMGTPVISGLMCGLIGGLLQGVKPGCLEVQIIPRSRLSLDVSHRFLNEGGLHLRESGVLPPIFLERLNPFRTVEDILG